MIVIDETIQDPGYLAEACNMVQATNVTVTSTGEATLRAGALIVLEDGFVIEQGGELSAIIDPTVGS